MAPSRRTRRSPSEKTKFVLGLPHDLPASEVVAKAKQKGHDVSLHQVHNIRWRAKQSASSPIRAVAKATERPKGTARAKKTMRLAERANVGHPKVDVRGRVAADSARVRVAINRQTAERQLLAMVLEFGLHGTDELLNEVRDKVAALANA